MPSTRTEIQLGNFPFSLRVRRYTFETSFGAILPIRRKRDCIEFKRNAAHNQSYEPTSKNISYFLACGNIRIHFADIVKLACIVCRWRIYREGKRINSSLRLQSLLIYLKEHTHFHYCWSTCFDFRLYLK